MNTADLCDRFGDQVQVCDAVFRSFGGRNSFAGPAVTSKCFEDNSRVRELVNMPGDGRVLVVDAGGSLRRAVLGDQLASNALANGYRGILIYGALRDAAAIAAMPLGVFAVGTCPMRTDKRGEGQRDITIRFAGVTCAPGNAQ